MFTMTRRPPSSAPAPAPGADSRPLIAHIDPSDPSRTESLATHASNVRSAASRFGARFGCASTAAFAGCIHDFGKAAPEVQDSLWSFPTGAFSKEEDIAILLTYPMASHYTGILDSNRQRNYYFYRMTNLDCFIFTI